MSKRVPGRLDELFDGLQLASQRKNCDDSEKGGHNNFEGDLVVRTGTSRGKEKGSWLAWR